VTEELSHRTSRGDAEMAAQLRQLDPASPRFGVLQAARAFKASWVALGQRLTLARESNGFVEWGFSSFEAYCRRELRIRQDTANKLTRSFAFLRDHQPDVLESAQTRDMPPLDVVDLLSQARDRTQVADATLATLQQEAFAPDARSTKQGLLKKLREHDPQAFRPAPEAAPEQPPPADAPVRPVELRKALLLAERLESLLSGHQGISDQAIAHARSVVGELRERFAAQQRQQAA
jgi:hypothetical protein